MWDIDQGLSNLETSTNRNNCWLCYSTESGVSISWDTPHVSEKSHSVDFFAGSVIFVWVSGKKTEITWFFSILISLVCLFLNDVWRKRFMSFGEEVLCLERSQKSGLASLVPIGWPKQVA